MGRVGNRAFSVVDTATVKVLGRSRWGLVVREGGRPSGGVRFCSNTHGEPWEALEQEKTGV